MIRRPPRSTRTDTLFPFPTLFRSLVAAHHDAVVGRLVAVLVGRNELDFDVQGQGAHRAGVAVVLSGEGADVSHDDSPEVSSPRPSRPCVIPIRRRSGAVHPLGRERQRSEAHTSGLQSLIRSSYAVL